MKIGVIPHGGAAYAQLKQLRQDVLRTPLGLTLSDQDVAGEEEQILIAAQDVSGVTGCVILKPLAPGRVRLRQMAVAGALQGRGLGGRLVRFAEDTARAQGFACVECHARISARPFYEKLGYAAAGGAFIEVGLPTVMMRKSL